MTTSTKAFCAKLVGGVACVKTPDNTLGLGRKSSVALGVLGGVAVVAVLGAGLVGGLLRNRRCRHAVVKVRPQWMDE